MGFWDRTGVSKRQVPWETKLRWWTGRGDAVGLRHEPSVFMPRLCFRVYFLRGAYTTGYDMD